MHLQRILAFIYDTIIIFSLLIAATILVLFFRAGAEIPSGNILFKFYLLNIILLYFIYFWCKNGQTSGMAAWKIKLLDQNFQPISVIKAFFRFIILVITLGVGLKLYDRKFGIRVVKNNSLNSNQQH